MQKTFETGLKTDYSILLYLFLSKEFGQIGNGYLSKQCEEIGIDHLQIEHGDIKRVAAQIGKLFVSLGMGGMKQDVRDNILGFSVLDDPEPSGERKRQKARLLIDVAEFHLRNPETKGISEEKFDKALELLDNDDDSGEESFRVFQRKAEILSASERYSKAIRMYTKALEHSDSATDRFAVYDCWLGLGSCYWRKAEHPKAKETMERCVEFAKTIPSENSEKAPQRKAAMARAYNVLGNIEVDLANYEDALTNLEKAKEIYHKLGDRNSEGLVYNNLGTAYDDMPPDYLPAGKNKWLEAIKQYERGIDILKGGKTSRQKAHYVRILANASRAYSWSGKMPMSNRRIEEANSTLKRIEDKIEQVNMLKSMVYFGFAIHFQNRKPTPHYETAIKYYERSIEKAIESEARDYLHRSYHELGRMYAKMRKKDKAAMYLQLARDGYEKDGQTRRLNAVLEDMDTIVS